MLVNLYYSLAVTEKIGRLAGKNGEHIIVKVEELFVESVYAVEIHFNWVAIECRQIL
jgi:hypothetical protein